MHAVSEIIFLQKREVLFFFHEWQKLRMTREEVDKWKKRTYFSSNMTFSVATDFLSLKINEKSKNQGEKVTFFH